MATSGALRGVKWSILGVEGKLPASVRHEFFWLILSCHFYGWMLFFFYFWLGYVHEVDFLPVELLDECVIVLGPIAQILFCSAFQRPQLTMLLGEFLVCGICLKWLSFIEYFCDARFLVFPQI